MKPSIRKLTAVAILTPYLSLYVMGIISGVMDRPYFFVGGFFCALLLLGSNRPRWAENLVLLITTVSLTMAGLDLISRPFLKDWPYKRPRKLVGRRWPYMPALSRYYNNVRYSGNTFGDLAAMSGISDARETRNIVFRTDSFGFPNGESTTEEALDVIVLGDSMMAGSFISQDRILANVLKTQYGLRIYNLSVGGITPWHELLNLKVELPRLKTREGTTVLWSIFTGNDLDGPFSDDMEPHIIDSSLKRFRVELSSFRNSSPIRQMTSTFTAVPKASQVAAREFLDKRKMLFYLPYAQAAAWTPEEIAAHHNSRNLTKVFEEMGRFANSNKLKVAVMSVPTKEEVYQWVLERREPWTSDSTPSAFAENVRHLCEQNSLAFLDMKPGLIAESKRVFDESGEVLWWYDDTHWNERGHERAAAMVHGDLLAPSKEHARNSASVHSN